MVALVGAPGSGKSSLLAAVYTRRLPRPGQSVARGGHPAELAVFYAAGCSDQPDSARSIASYVIQAVHALIKTHAVRSRS